MYGIWSLPVAGIEGAFDGEGAKTVIPRKVIGKFSIRLVPNMQPEAVERLVIDFLEKRHKNSGSPNPIKFVHYTFLVVYMYLSNDCDRLKIKAGIYAFTCT